MQPPVRTTAPARVATSERLGEELLRLRSTAAHERDGEWVVGRPAEVAAVLASPDMSVSLGPGVGATEELRSRTARFTDGPEHAARRRLAEMLLPPARQVGAAAQELTAAALGADPGPLDGMPIARAVPVAALAVALGVPVAGAHTLSGLTGTVCDTLAPSLRPAANDGPGDGGATALLAELTRLGPWDGQRADAVAGLLIQARDATAALIGAALLARAADRSLTASAAVDAAARRAAPVQCTRRRAARLVVLNGTEIPQGSEVWVFLGAAEPGPPTRPATFGSGPHACPGADHAVAVATAFLEQCDRLGWRPAARQRVSYEPRPNLRMPVSVLLERTRP